MGVKYRLDVFIFRIQSEFCSSYTDYNVSKCALKFIVRKPVGMFTIFVHHIYNPK